MYDLLVRNGKLVTPDRIYEADIAIQDGKYAAFLAKGTEAEAKEVIANKIMNNVKNGDIILLHDYATNNTVEALDILIPKMIEKGFEFVTVSEIINK